MCIWSFSVNQCSRTHQIKNYCRTECSGVHDLNTDEIQPIYTNVFINRWSIAYTKG